ncbi:PAS domain-containing protein [Neorhizobium galegae bv. officinalis]|uniref:PAS domain-containing protein n=1 Tax=Neorhizobium galegae bv. officinalis TaxID=323656 RepID=A0A0T7FKB1_NEOGA|nr:MULTISPECIES: PAS domain-containing protein [Neorhizobium]CDZ35442.1 PAS domain-containing protein [Neorhizobium galegae bv. officinalis]
MEALIDLFWSKYADLRQAVERNDDDATASLDRDLDPLLLAVFSSQSKDPASIQAQFRFALDLLNEEADDRGCVRRNGHLLQMLVERYVVPETGLSANRRPEPEPHEHAVIADATADGFLDDALLNRISDRIVVIAPGYRIFYSNETNARRLDLARDALIGRHFAEFVGLHRFKNDFKPNLDRCFAGESISLTYADQTDGQTVVVRCRMSPCVSGSSQLIGALLVMQETADRRRRPAA